MQISPFLWYDRDLAEVIDRYQGIFADFQLDSTTPGHDGGIMMASFRIAGQRILALNGGPDHPFTDAISLFVSVDTQQQVDDLWAALTADGGAEGRCGWLTDRFGVSWQIIPTALGQLMGDPDPAKSGRVVQAMLAMNRIEIAGLEAAHRGD